MAEAERVKPRALFVEEAIQLALESNWQEAVAINRTILEKHGPEEDAYNRLGKALSELGRLEEALEAYGETLKLNPLNVIAQKNQRKLAAMLEQPARVEGVHGSVDVDLFAEEPGKSALTVLSRPSGACWCRWRRAIPSTSPRSAACCTPPPPAVSPSATSRPRSRGG